VAFEALEKLADEFPIDVKRLRLNPELKDVFVRYQRAPDTMEDHDVELDRVTDVFAMPLATAALPESSWDRAMTLMKKPHNRVYLKRLVERWQDRAPNYSTVAADELARKIRRHDSERILIRTIQQLGSARSADAKLSPEEERELGLDPDSDRHSDQDSEPPSPSQSDPASDEEDASETKRSRA
jgi:hypothetical protein